MSFLGLNFKVYKRYIKFIKIKGSYLGENLAKILKRALRKHGLL